MHIAHAGLAQSILSTPRVLVIEDDEAVAQAMIRSIERSGMSVARAATGAVGMSMTGAFNPDVVLVDLELPDTNGVDLIGWFADRGSGVIAVSGASDESDRIVGLELGADDYISKPPRLREMVARIRAVHRRVTRGRDEPKQSARVPDTVVVGPIRINMVLRAVTTQDGRRLQLTSAEFTLLEALAQTNGQTVSRDTLSAAALRRPWRPEDRSVDQLVFSLRQKLPPDEGGATLIHSVRGAGYLLRTADCVV